MIKPGRPLVLTMGDPAGIAGEITLKAWAALNANPAYSFCVIADPDWLSLTAHHLGLAVPLAVIDRPAEAMRHFPDALPVIRHPLTVAAEPGQGDSANAGSVVASIRKAVEFVQSGVASGIVTNPINKRSLYEDGFSFPGHTEYLGALCGPDSKPVMMLVGGGLRVIPVTIHVPLKDVAGLLTTALIVDRGLIVAKALTEQFGIARPRLAIAAFNPHAGEGGSMGCEEIDIIAPAVDSLKSAGIDASGPHPSDTLFHPAARDRYDAVLCMYHDQALIPIKTLAFDSGVNATLGLPIIRTSPDHGTAYDIAGKGIAHPGSLIAAIQLAAALTNQQDRP